MKTERNNTEQAKEEASFAAFTVWLACIVAVVFMVFPTLAPVSAADSADQIEVGTVSSQQPALITGEKLFSTNCIGCHGPGGRGGIFL